MPPSIRWKTLFVVDAMQGQDRCPTPPRLFKDALPLTASSLTKTGR